MGDADAVRGSVRSNRIVRGLLVGGLAVTCALAAACEGSRFDPPKIYRKDVGERLPDGSYALRLSTIEDGALYVRGVTLEMLREEAAKR